MTLSSTVRKYVSLICLVVAVFSFVGLQGCKSTQTEKATNPLTVGEVKRTIVKGQTNQSEIMTTFGSPNMVTRNKRDQEVWSYSRMSFDSKRSDAFGGLLFFGGSKATASQSSASFDLIITFDKKDVVTDYEVIQTKY